MREEASRHQTETIMVVRNNFVSLRRPSCTAVACFP